MQLYFIKATYTNNLYALADFFSGTSFKLTATKKLDVNFKPDDGLTSFITSQLILPDETSIRDHTHIIVPEYSKIYKIISIDVMNKEQWMVTCDEDPFIANYQTLKDANIFLTRTNDYDLWRGVNDIADMTLEEEIEIKTKTNSAMTGKWALLFFQYNPEDNYIGLKFDHANLSNMERYSNITAITTQYPEVYALLGFEPEKYDYFQKIVYNSADSKCYQCVYDPTTSQKRLYWVEYQGPVYEEHYFKVSHALGAKINQTDVMTTCIALPFESDFIGGGSVPILSYGKFIGPIDTSIIDIKIVSDLVMPIDTISYNLASRVMTKTLTFLHSLVVECACYDDDDGSDVSTGFKTWSIRGFVNDIDISANFSYTPEDEPLLGEPFRKYDLYIYGKKFTVPYYMTNDIHLLIAITSGVCNYIIYFNEKRNIIGSGSFTHSIRYQIDQLDAFYSQNPTYKEQFFTKMAVDSVKNIVGGAVAGSVVPGIGTVVGAVAGLGASVVDAGIGMLNLHYQEKGLKLKPDQIFGEVSEVALQMVNIFGVYWVKRTSVNDDLMLSEFALRGFPTSSYTTIDDLSFIYSTLFEVPTKIVFGEIKQVIKNEYVTAYINQKLKEGVIFL